MRVPLIRAALTCSIILGASALAAGEEFKPIPRVLPPMGVKLPEAVQKQVEAGLEKLEHRIKEANFEKDLLADVAVYEKAVRYALLNDEFYTEKTGGPTKDGSTALHLIETANKRLDELEHGQHSWTSAHGQFVRGYFSEIDGSPQPYGLDIPEGLDLSKPVPLYIWLHGRGDKETDLHFIAGREGHKGQIEPAGAIVVHPFGRQCMGWKSAGEIDVQEVIASVEKRYKIDPDRVVLMGFSMGGAGAWHIGAHYTDEFCAVHAGAGFVDVVRFDHLKPEEFPPAYEQVLWGQYDVPDYVRNFFNVTTVAYGGEIDKQREAGEIMSDAFKAEGRELTRLVGPKMPHKYDPASLADIMHRMDEAVKKGRDTHPNKITLQTRTLRYNHMYWAAITGLTEHWKDSRLDAELTPNNEILVNTKNVERFSLQSPQARSDSPQYRIKIQSDESKLDAGTMVSWRGNLEFEHTTEGWRIVRPQAPDALRKKPGLQGPIDDAFLSPFLVVTPSGKSDHEEIQKWVDFELPHFHSRWRELFRGELPTKKDTEVTPEDIAQYNLILWGDDKSNRLIAQLAGKTPFTWTSKELAVGGKSYDASTHIPLAIYPNPLNPAKYVVLNSGPTFREGSDHTNSLQNPKLPDWAVIDITTPPDGNSAGKVEAAGFFDEQWKVK